MAITATMIKDLRGRTGSGMMDCKKALTEADGDMDRAIEFLRKKGLAKAAKKAGRIATEGSVTSYIHSNGRIGVLLEVNCETDFVARNEDFVKFAKDVSMQIAAMAPLHVRQDDVPADFIAKERAILKATALESGKPEKIVDKIVDGQVSKWLKSIVLLDQEFVKNEGKEKMTIGDLEQALVAKLGENCRIRRFVRFELGEGLEKKSEDFAAEVAKQAGLA